MGMWVMALPWSLGLHREQQQAKCNLATVPPHWLYPTLEQSSWWSLLSHQEKPTGVC